MRISVVTPTCDRPFGIALAEKYMARQTIKPYEWIVADGGKVPARCTLRQTHLHEPSPSGAVNLATNVIRAMDAASGDAIVMWRTTIGTRPTTCRSVLMHSHTKLPMDRAR